MSTAILFSGGLDSTAAAILNPEAQLIRVSIGSRYDAIERTRASAVAQVMGKRLLHIDGVVNLSRYERDDALVPARNAMLALAAAQHAQGLTLVSVNGDGTHATDKDQEFADLMTALISKLFADARQVSVPYRNISKMQLARRAMMYDPECFGHALRFVYSCYSGRDDGSHCGTCKACVRLYAALHYIDHEESYHWPVFANTPSDLTMDAIEGIYEGRGDEAAIALHLYRELKELP